MMVLRYLNTTVGTHDSRINPDVENHQPCCAASFQPYESIYVLMARYTLI